MDYGAVLPPSLMVFSLYCQGLFGDIGNGRIFAWWLVSLPNNIITLHWKADTLMNIEMLQKNNTRWLKYKAG